MEEAEAEESDPTEPEESEEEGNEGSQSGEEGKEGSTKQLAEESGELTETEAAAAWLGMCISCELEALRTQHNSPGMI